MIPLLYQTQPEAVSRDNNSMHCVLVVILMSGWHRNRKYLTFRLGKGSACNVAKHKLVIGKIVQRVVCIQLVILYVHCLSLVYIVACM